MACARARAASRAEVELRLAFLARGFWSCGPRSDRGPKAPAPPRREAAGCAQNASPLPVTRAAHARSAAEARHPPRPWLAPMTNVLVATGRGLAAAAATPDDGPPTKGRARRGGRRGDGESSLKPSDKTEPASHQGVVADMPILNGEEVERGLRTLASNLYIVSVGLRPSHPQTTVRPS